MPFRLRENEPEGNASTLVGGAGIKLWRRERHRLVKKAVNCQSGSHARCALIGRNAHFGARGKDWGLSRVRADAGLNLVDPFRGNELNGSGVLLNNSIPIER